MAQCGDCTYARPAANRPAQLQCHCSPPVFANDPYLTTASRWVATWPVVQPTDWCGEYGPIIEEPPPHVARVRVRALDPTLNNAVANGALLRFDTVDADTDGFAPATTPFDFITIPPGLDGVYFLLGTSSGAGNQSTSLGMGIRVNAAVAFAETNQSISGPSSVNYVLDNNAIDIGHLAAGAKIQVVNNSVSPGTNVFTSVLLVLARLGP